MLLNTATSLADYRAFYADLPPAHFSLLRNGFDRDLTGHGFHGGFDRFTLLHLGNFSRFRLADPLVELLGLLVGRGVPVGAIQIATTGPFGAHALQRAAALGVAECIVRVPAVAYPETGALMAAADVLVYVAEPNARQRIASKLYDYLGSPRPILSIADNPESADLLERCGGGVQAGVGDIDKMATFVLGEFRAGRQRMVQRRDVGMSAYETAGRLAEVLGAVVAGRRVD